MRNTDVSNKHQEKRTIVTDEKYTTHLHASLNIEWKLFHWCSSQVNQICPHWWFLHLSLTLRYSAKTFFFWRGSSFQTLSVYKRSYCSNPTSNSHLKDQDIHLIKNFILVNILWMVSKQYTQNCNDFDYKKPHTIIGICCILWSQSYFPVSRSQYLPNSSVSNPRGWPKWFS